MLEIALSLTAFLLLTFGVMEFAMAAYAYNFCSYAARDATRWASVHGAQSTSPATSDQVTSLVRSEAVGFATNNLSVSTTWLPDNSPGSVVKVSVSYNVVPLVGLALQNTLQVGSTSQMIIVH